MPKVAICDTDLGAVFFLDVIDDAIAAFLAEVDVEVGHRNAVRIEEALEDQVVLQRIEIGDAQRIRDQRARARAAPRPDRHAVVLGPVDEIGNDQEVAGETHVHDGLDLVFEAGHVARALCVAFCRFRIQRRQALLQPGRGGMQENTSSIDTPFGVGKFGSFGLPSMNSKWQRLAISSAFSIASGMSANSAAFPRPT